MLNLNGDLRYYTGLFAYCYLKTTTASEEPKKFIVRSFGRNSFPAQVSLEFFKAYQI